MPGTITKLPRNTTQLYQYRVVAKPDLAGSVLSMRTCPRFSGTTAFPGLTSFALVVSYVYLESLYQSVSFLRESRYLLQGGVRRESAAVDA